MEPAPAAIESTPGNILKHDGPAGLVTFLVGLPLCLGIALGSGAPLFSGVIGGIVGGLIVSILSDSQVSVTGSAAGMAAIVIAGIHDIGSFQGFLVAVVISGLLQLAFGFLRLGAIANYVPNSVIKGMLAGIGAIIILKQVPHALGWDRDFVGNFKFFESGGRTVFSDIASAAAAAAPGAVIISTLSLAVLLIWEWAARKSRLFQLFPGPLAVVVLGIALNQIFGVISPSLQLVAADHMVNLPVPGSVSDFFRQFSLPDLSVISHKSVWTAGATLAVVSSLMTLLSLDAADRLDPLKRISSPNRELFAQGVGNMLCGLIGGLPIASVAVRTSANVEAGARTWRASFIHGLLLLVASILLPGVLRLTPLASLAAILIVVGYKLTKPALYRAAYSLGWDQFVPFVTTAIAVTLADVLVGVLIGFACGLFFLVRTNHHDAITVVNQDSNYLFRFNKDASFINKNEFRTKLRELPAGSHVVVDGSGALFFDRDIEETLQDFRQMAPYKQIEVTMKQWAADRPSEELRTAEK